MEVGRNVKQPTGYSAFIPSPFPTSPPFHFDPQATALLERANLLLGRLDGITELLPDIEFFIFMYVRKEATLSSQLEGTQATMVDSIKAENAMRLGIPADVDDISRYIEAMNRGLNRLNEIPLSLRLIREVHNTLLQGAARSSGHVLPGEFRTTQNWIGGGSPATARYVPPPPYELGRALSDLEKFLHADDEISKVVKAGLAHAQFETIHPFADGNGRTGRLMITFFLCEQRVLSRPTLYLSAYFKKNRDSYFDALHAYHEHGDQIGWIKFFLNGVAEVAEEAIQTCREIMTLREKDIAKVACLGRSVHGITLLQHLFRLPIVSVRNIEQLTSLSRPNANKLVAKFVDAGILRPSDESVEYGRTFVYHDYLSLFSN